MPSFDPARSAAVLIGASQFDDPDLPALPAVANNLADLRATLTAPNVGFVPDHVAVLPNPRSTTEIVRVLRMVAKSATDTLLVYYAGHGLLDEHNVLHLATTTTTMEDVDVDGMDITKLRRRIRDSPARTRLLILDCCYSGLATATGMSDPISAVTGQLATTGTWTLTATAPTVVALAPVGARHTAFTGELLELLNSGIADEPGDLSCDLIFRTLRDRLRDKDLPVPRQLGSESVATFVLARNIRRVAVSAVRPDIRGPEFEMCAVPAGDVRLTNSWDPTSADTHVVTEEAFAISRFPVTTAQYQLFISSSDGWSTGRWGNADWDLNHDHHGHRNDRTPVLVTRYEAIAYCRWLSARTGRRLFVPRESQWLRAAQGDDLDRSYPWGDDFDDRRCHCSFSKKDRRRTPVDVEAHPAGASVFGVEDLVGNAPEWVVLGEVEHVEESGVFHVRGADWDSTNPRDFRCDFRGHGYAPMPEALAGFRVCEHLVR